MNRKKFIKDIASVSLLLSSNNLIEGFSKLAFSSDNVSYLKKNDAEYEILRKGFNKRINHSPQIIALCYNTAGVQEAVKHARQNKLPIAIKSGGHCMEGFSGNDGGMVINLSKLNSLTWVDENTIKVGPALMLKDLYGHVLHKGKILPGGSCQSVALGGLTLGGGYGLLSRQFGLTCDSLLDVTMVDGKGTVVKSGSELLWACRGGGNGNFGVITEMKYKVHKAPAIMQSFRLRYKNIPVGEIKPLLKKWFEVAATLPNECFSACIVNSKSIYILVTTTNKNEATIQKQLNNLKAVTKTFEHSKPKPIADALKVYYAENQPIFFKNASAGLYKTFSDIDGCIDKVINIVRTSPGMLYQINTLGGAVQNANNEAASSFPYRTYNFFSELQAYYDTPTQGAKLIVKFEEIQQVFDKHGIKAQYRNYPDANFKNPLELYYGENLERLKAIKYFYDAENNIRHPQSII